MPFVQSCVLCGDHQKFMHNPGLTPCPTCGAAYCKSCFSRLPKVKVGLLRTQPQCPRCAQASAAARAPFAAYQPPTGPVPGYAPTPPPQVVIVQPAAASAPQAQPIVYLHCKMCGGLAPGGAVHCTFCGARL